jgi:hypothetical protein
MNGRDSHSIGSRSAAELFLRKKWKGLRLLRELSGVTAPLVEKARLVDDAVAGNCCATAKLLGLRSPGGVTGRSDSVDCDALLATPLVELLGRR